MPRNGLPADTTLLRVLVLLALIAAIVLFARGQRDHMRILETPKGSIGSLDGDRQVLAQLRKAGADLTKPTEVNFYLYFKDREAADSAAAHASAGPLIATVRPPLGEGKPWLLPCHRPDVSRRDGDSFAGSAPPGTRAALRRRVRWMGSRRAEVGQASTITSGTWMAFGTEMLRRLSGWIRRRLRETHEIRGFRVLVDNSRPDIETSTVLERLDDALALVERYQPHRYWHLKRDLSCIWIARYPCRGAYFPRQRTCLTELTFLARRDISPAVVAISRFCTKEFMRESIDFGTISGRRARGRIQLEKSDYAELRSFHLAGPCQPTSRGQESNVLPNHWRLKMRRWRQSLTGSWRALGRMSPTRTPLGSRSALRSVNADILQQGRNRDDAS